MIFLFFLKWSEGGGENLGDMSPKTSSFFTLSLNTTGGIPVCVVGPLKTCFVSSLEIHPLFLIRCQSSFLSATFIKTPRLDTIHQCPLYNYTSINLAVEEYIYQQDPIYKSIYLSIYLYISLSINESLSINLSIYLYIHLSICILVYLLTSPYL